MGGFCGYDPHQVTVPERTVYEQAISALSILPNFQFDVDPQVTNPPIDQHSDFEDTITSNFETIIRESAPYLVNVDTAGILITTFMLLTTESIIFRFLVANAMRLGRFLNLRFENRYQVDRVRQNEARGLTSLVRQRDYIRGLTPAGVFLNPTALSTGRAFDANNWREQFHSHLYMDVTVRRQEEGLNFVNLPMMVQDVSWDTYIQFATMFVHGLTRALLDLPDPPRGSPDLGTAQLVTRGIMYELTGRGVHHLHNYRQNERTALMTSIQFNFLLQAMRDAHATDHINRIGDLALRVNFDEPLDQAQLIGGDSSEATYARYDMNQLDVNSHIGNPRRLMPWTDEQLEESMMSFLCRFSSNILSSLERSRRIYNRVGAEEDEPREKREVDKTIGPITFSRKMPKCYMAHPQPIVDTCAERSENLNIVERQFMRTVRAGKMMKSDYASWYEYFGVQSWSAMRDEGAKMAGRTCFGFWSCMYGNYGYRFNDGSFALGITSLSIGMSDNDNWIFENGNRHENWNDQYNGQILFDRNGRPVVIVMGLYSIVSALRRTVWVYEFTERNVWKWSRVEWQPPANKLSKNKGPWMFSLRARSLIQVDDFCLVDNLLNLDSTHRIVEMHCNDSVIDSHPNWVSYYDDMHMKDFDTLKRVLFKDGSYALGISNPRRTKYDDITGFLMTDSWTVAAGNRDKQNYTNGPYFGVLMIDRQKRPLLAAFRENTNYISLNYYVDGNWRSADNNNWKEIAGSKGLARDPEAPRFKLTSC